MQFRVEGLGCKVRGKTWQRYGFVVKSRESVSD